MWSQKMFGQNQKELREKNPTNPEGSGKTFLYITKAFFHWISSFSDVFSSYNFNAYFLSKVSFQVKAALLKKSLHQPSGEQIRNLLFQMCQ